MKFTLDSRTKELLNDIASLFGVKPEIVKSIWEFTVFTWLLKYKDSTNKVVSCPIPFLGSIGLKYKGDSIDDKNNLTADLDCFVSVNDDFKKTVYNAMNDDYSDLSSYVKTAYIDKLIEDNK